MRTRSIRSLIGLVALALAWAGPALADPGDPGAWRKAAAKVRHGDRVFKQGNLSRAEKLYGQALELRSDLPEAHLGLGQIRLRQRRFDEALAAFDEAERHYRAEAESLYREARRRHHAAKVEASEHHRKIKVLKLNVELYETVTEEGNGRGTRDRRVKMNNMSSEVKELEREALRLDGLGAPPEAEEGVPGTVHFFRGNALLHLQRIPEAVAAWERCARIAPEFAPAHQNLAVAYLNQGRISEAVGSLERAKELGFPVPDALESAVRTAANSHGRSR